MPTVPETKAKLISFAELENGWHYGEGVPAKPEVIASALAILDKLSSVGIERVNAFPGIAGEARVTAYIEDDYHEFTVETNGIISYVHEQLDEEVESREGLLLHRALE